MSPKYLDKDSRPREKMINNGAGHLSNLELLQVVLGTGIAGRHVGMVAHDLWQLLQTKLDRGVTVSEVKSIRGISTAKATGIVAALEFARRYFASDELVLDKPAKIFPFVQEYSGKKQEHLVVLVIDGALRLLSKHLVSVGTLNSTLIHPREVFAPAIKERAAGVILVHNHPSGNLMPSEEDKNATAKLQQAAKLLGLDLYDHLIISPEQKHFSFKEQGLL